MHDIPLHNLRFAQAESPSPEEEKEEDLKLLQSLFAID
jgi:hypothetical protein